MRMDDFNQKENAMKLSLTTIDYRLAKLEEVALQTAENLYILQNILSLSQGLLRQASSDQSAPLSAGSSGGSSTSQPGSMDNGLSGSPSALSTSGGYDARMMGQAVLLPVELRKRYAMKHGGISMNEDRLKPFTDYSKNRRPPFMRAVTVATPGRLSQEYTIIHSNAVNINNEASDFSNVSHPGQKRKKSPPVTDSSPHLGSELYHRRRSKALSRLKAQGLFPKGKAGEILKDRRSRRARGIKSPARVTFSDPPSKEASPDARRTMSADAVEMFPSYSGNIGKTGVHSIPVDNLGQYTMASHNVDTHSTTKLGISTSSPPVNIPGNTNRLVEPPRSLGVSCAPMNKSGKSPSGSPTTAPITPIVTPNHCEYTTITDEIDCSGINYGSPSGSPTTPRQFYFGVDVDVDLYTKKSNQSMRNMGGCEAQQLKLAEDSEHEAMEMMIRKRMRQISLTESDSVSDIARHVMQEMENAERVPLEPMEPEYHSDDDIHWRDDDLILPALTKTNSEPSLNQLVGSFDSNSIASSSCHRLEANRSLSPPATANETRSPPIPEDDPVLESASSPSTAIEKTKTFNWPSEEHSSKDAEAEDTESPDGGSENQAEHCDVPDSANKRETMC